MQTKEPSSPECHPLAENLFDALSEDSSDEELLLRRKPTMLATGGILIPPQQQRKMYTIVFDLDETVIYGREGTLYARAFLKQLFQSIARDFEIVVWTASERSYAKKVLSEINEDHVVEHLVYRHSKWYCEDDCTKDLKKLGRNLDATIIVENTPDCIRCNPKNGIIVEDFDVQTSERSPGVKHTRSRDNTLIRLLELLQKLACSGRTVPDFLENCGMLSKRVVSGVDGNPIHIKYLDRV